MLFILLLIFLLVPWQVAFLGAWAILLYTCATSPRHAGTASETSLAASSGIDNEPRRGSDGNKSETLSVADQHDLDRHVLLLLTWLLPLVAPVLAVWVRTLFTAGWITPFDGDHNPLVVAPFLVLVDFASRTNGPLLPRQP
jgi:GPI inositol-deacylase